MVKTAKILKKEKYEKKLLEKFNKIKWEIYTKTTFNKIVEPESKKYSVSFKNTTEINNIYPYSINIKIVRNNLFCTFLNNKTGLVLTKCNAGKYRIKLSKKTLKFYFDKIILLFLKDRRIRAFKKTKKGLIIKILSPLRFKVKILTLLVEQLQNRDICVVYKPLKCFNGCKVSKIRRKKRKGFAVFK